MTMTMMGSSWNQRRLEERLAVDKEAVQNEEREA